MPYLRARRFVLFAVLSMLLAGIAIVPPAAAEEEERANSAPIDLPCRDARHERPGLGLACRVDIGFKIFLRDGSVMYTHGGDVVPPPIEVASHAMKAPFCVASTAEHHNIAIYTRPSDKANRYGEMAPKIRTMVHQANGHLYGEAQETGGTADYRFACTSGTVTVLSAALATPSGADTWSSIVSDLKDLGFNDPKAKYWIWHDDLIDCGCGGIAGLYSDSRRIVNNNNNGATGAMYAATFFESWTTMMHESGHNMGAVQLDAPGSNTLFHCNDGKDIMCYAEGGQPYNDNVCPTAHFDCQHNTYFNLNPAPGSYLDTNWNLGWIGNRYIQFGNAKPVMQALSCSPNPVDPGFASTCTFRATDQSLGVAYNVNWGDGSPVQRVPASGFVTPGADASAPHTWPGTPGSHTVTVTATDDASPGLTSDPLSTTQVVQNGAPIMTALSCTPSPAEDRAMVTCAFTATDGSPGVHYAVNWGDGSPSTRIPAAGHVTPGVSQQATHVWNTPGSFTVSVTATDNGPGTLASTPRTLSQTIANVAPVLSPLVCAPAPSADDEPVACTLLATDATHGVAYTVNWGDDSPATRIPSSGYMQAGVQTLATHAWTSGGSFTVSAVATDDSVAPLSSVVRTFSQQVIVKPRFTDPLCITGSGAIDTFEGSSLSRTLSANSKIGSRVITLSLTSGPPGLSVTGAPGNPASATLSWPAPAVGSHAALVTATDNTGATRQCALIIRVAPLGGESLAQGVWIGNAVPVGFDDDSGGARVTSPGTATTRQVNLIQPLAQLVVEAVEETVDLTVQGGQVISRGATQVSEARFLNGALAIEGLTQDATLTLTAATGSATVSSTPRIGRILLNGVPLPLPAEPTPTEFVFPGGSRLVLYENGLTSEGADTIYRENLVHLYVRGPYGRGEVILGSIVLRAGGQSGDRLGQERLIDPQDDAGSGRDAGPDASGAVAIAPGVHDGRFVGTDTRDVYALALKHGENVKLIVQGATQTKLVGGSATMMGTTTTPTAPTTRLELPETFVLRLVDPAGTTRVVDFPILFGVATRVELNADIDGTWLVDIERSAAGRPDANYTLAATVTPLVLLPQQDALAPGDAPDVCGPGAPLISSGAWPGVLRDNDRIDVYSFHAELGQLIGIVLKPGEDHDGFEAALAFYDRNCALIERSIPTLFGLKGTPKAITQTPAGYTGTYYVGIERLNGVGNTYLSLAVVDPQPAAPVHDAGTGQDAPADRNAAMDAPPGAFQGRLPDGDAGDAYNLRFRPGSTATVAITGSALSIFSMTLRTPTGDTVLTSVAGFNMQVWSIGTAMPGAYTLEIIPLVGGGSYTVAYGPPVV